MLAIPGVALSQLDFACQSVLTALSEAVRRAVAKKPAFDQFIAVRGDIFGRWINDLPEGAMPRWPYFPNPGGSGAHS